MTVTLLPWPKYRQITFWCAKVIGGFFTISGLFGVLFFAPNLGFGDVLYLIACALPTLAPKEWFDNNEKGHLLTVACCIGLFVSVFPFPIGETVWGIVVMAAFRSMPIVLFLIVLRRSSHSAKEVGVK